MPPFEYQSIYQVVWKQILDYYTKLLFNCTLFQEAIFSLYECYPIYV